jgi:hypothetical protein
MPAYVSIPNLKIYRPCHGFELGGNSTYIAGFLFFWGFLSFFSEPFSPLIRRSMDNESGLPGGEMEFRDVTGLFLEAADGKCLSQGLLSFE